MRVCREKGLTHVAMYVLYTQTRRRVRGICRRVVLARLVYE